MRKRSRSHPVRGTDYVVSSGSHFATEAAADILRQGGNAVDAGVAAGLVINVCQPDMTSLGGVAPILVRLADSGRVHAISGLGGWPELADSDTVSSLGKRALGLGIFRTVVPAAVDAWLTALAQFGTFSLREVVEPALRLAEDGFAVDERYCESIAHYRRHWFADMPYNSEYFAIDGHDPEPGEVFRQPALAQTLRRLRDAETARPGISRSAGIMAARNEFYTGGIAREIDEYYRANGGLLRLSDLERFSVEIEEPLVLDYQGWTVYGTQAWSQGIVLLEALNILKTALTPDIVRGSVEYIHVLSEALDLAFSDREHYVGDPRFVDVPVRTLLSEEYGRRRAAQIDPAKAFGAMPPAGDLSGAGGSADDGPAAADGAAEPDTSYVSVIDRWGNAFSATPSDAPSTPVIPGLGFTVSSRGYQSWLEPDHPSGIAPGKRPRLTPNPGIAVRGDRLIMAFGAAGGDRQPQAMLQFLLGLIRDGMNVQEAIDAPRFASHNFPSSGFPNTYAPGLLRLEEELLVEVGDALARLGHDVQGQSEELFEEFAMVCACLHDRVRGSFEAGADRRRTAAAIGR